MKRISIILFFLTISFSVMAKKTFSKLIGRYGLTLFIACQNQYCII